MSGDAADERWLLRDVIVDGRRVDCRLRGGVIAEVASPLAPAPGELIIEGEGAPLLPGLADHHVHLFAAAAATRSLALDGGLLADAPQAPGTGWLRVIGVGELVDRAQLDARWPARPVRAQHRSGAVWTLNSRAVELIGDGLAAEERRTGQVWRGDDRLRALIGTAVDADAVAAIGRDLARWGVTHVVEATAELDADSLAILRRLLPQHVRSLAAGDEAMPRKIVVADSDLPEPDELAARIATLHGQARPVAVHAVSAVALAVTISALATAGPLLGDRIEHAAVCDDDAAHRLADLGVIVVTQPALAVRHGMAYRADTEPGDRPWLWRLAGLRRAGVGLALSSDGPYGPLDPWQTMRAAVDRRLADGTMLGVAEALTPAEALASLLAHPHDPAGGRRPVCVGAPADLMLLDRPFADALAAQGCPVVATFAAGARIDTQQRGRDSS